MIDEMSCGCMRQSVNTRSRTFVKSCWNCNNSSPDPDNELEGVFCMMDGATVDPSMVCPDWELAMLPQVQVEKDKR